MQRLAHEDLSVEERCELEDRIRAIRGEQAIRRAFDTD
jgi:hypothetical protein